MFNPTQTLVYRWLPAAMAASPPVSALQYAVVVGKAVLVPTVGVLTVMQNAVQAVGKITLSSCAGAIYVATHKTNVSQMRGLGFVVLIRLKLSSGQCGVTSLDFD